MIKPSESIRYFEELMRSPRSSSDTSSLGHIKHSSSIDEGELSKNGEKRNKKFKGKPTFHHCDNLGCTINICKSKNGMQNPKPNFTCNYFNCKNQGNQVKLSDTLKN